MFHIVLVHPEIPPNTGNVMRLAANTGCTLHLVEPLGFALDDARLRRAGLDYHEFASVSVHSDWSAFRKQMHTGRLIAFSTRGRGHAFEMAYQPGDCLIFGSETRGLPEQVLTDLKPEHLLRLPMRPDNRSLNLSNAVAVVAFEAWRQNHFEGAAQRIDPL